jgi:hypothetical protein
MYAHIVFGTSVAATVLLLTLGLVRTSTPISPASAQECCASKSRDAACVPCRPTRGVK